MQEIAHCDNKNSFICVYFSLYLQRLYTAIPTAGNIFTVTLSVYLEVILPYRIRMQINRMEYSDRSAQSIDKKIEYPTYQREEEIECFCPCIIDNTKKNISSTCKTHVDKHFFSTSYKVNEPVYTSQARWEKEKHNTGPTQGAITESHRGG